MERIENEGFELGADVVRAMVQAFGSEHKARVDRFYTDFYEAKEKTERRLPPRLESLTQEVRFEVQSAIVEFLTTIKSRMPSFSSSACGLMPIVLAPTPIDLKHRRHGCRHSFTASLGATRFKGIAD
ncbi:hypothetical protein [Bradyrhizobium monzae]|uniref:hypothetical protein n=1 Tax=Bradyrhizobium sp. Oc8 TaxID=2876780 RepID=UPI001F2E56F0|nr:hypothetical protein [Bradyrhizobium sp. Oc8]